MKELPHTTVLEALNSERWKELGDEIKDAIEKGASVEIYREIVEFTDGRYAIGNGRTIIINDQYGPNLYRVLDVKDKDVEYVMKTKGE